VDISGGKKSMVSGSQLAANIFGFDVYYVDFEEFDIKQRRPVHGTEFINSLNPQLDAIFEWMEFGSKQLLEKTSIPEILNGFKYFVKSNGGAINAFWESRLSCKLKSSPEGIGQGLLLSFLDGMIGKFVNIYGEVSRGIGEDDIEINTKGKTHIIELKIAEPGFSLEALAKVPKQDNLSFRVKREIFYNQWGIRFLTFVRNDNL